jgi:hypothetical protein
LEVKGVVWVVGVVRVAAYRLSHGDQLSHIFNDPLAFGQMAGGEHTFAVHLGRMHMNGTENRQVAQSGLFNRVMTREA